MDLFNVEGKFAIVIGCGSIGTAISAGLARGGAELIICDISTKNAERALSAVRQAGAKAHVHIVDINTLTAVKDLFVSAKQIFPRLDILVNAAGINKGAPALEMQEPVWNEVMNHFINSVFWCCREAAEWMISGGEGGKILNVASMSGVVCTGDNGSPYAAAKAAVIHLTRYLACEWVKKGVYVNAISPGMVYSDLTSIYFDGNPGMVAATEGKIPLGRIGNPGDMVGPALFLLSGASDYVVGQNLLVDGGYTLW